MKDHYRIGDTIYDLSKMLKQITETRLKHLQLGQGQLNMLLFLLKDKNSAGLYQEQLAAALGINKANVSRNLAKLGDKNLVRIVPDSRDERRNRAIPTAEAESLKEEISGFFLDIYSSMAAGIGEEEMAAAYETLKKMLTNLDKAGGGLR